MFLHDVTQAYLQSKQNVTRKVYIKVKKADLDSFGMQSGTLLRLQKPLYGICNAGDYWGVTMEKPLFYDLGMTLTIGDKALYVKHKRNKTIGICGSYVDNSLNAGCQEFEALTKATLAKFESKPKVYDSFDFYGCQIETIAPRICKVSQRYYIQNLNPAPMCTSFGVFRRYRALFSWIGQTRPDLLYQANRMAQVTSQTFSKSTIRGFNVTVKSAKSNADMGLVFRVLH